MRGLWARARADEPAGLAGWAASTLAASGLHGDGLYVATGSAGARESVAFFRGAMASGLAFANPRLFPWALANSPTGAIARALAIRGPTYTLLGGSSAVEAAFEHALDDLADGLIAAALVVAVDAVDAGEGGLEVAAIVVAGGPAPAFTPGAGAAATLGLLVRNFMKGSDSGRPVG